jgi:hypothetical protein
MFAMKWAGAFLLSGLLLATPSLAGRASVLQGMPVTPASDVQSPTDHYSLAVYYEEQAQRDRSKADEWDFLANYHETFPEEFHGTSPVIDYVARCRAMAEDYRNLEKWHHKLAVKHTNLMRKDVIP